MKKILFVVCMLVNVCRSELTVSQWNMMYHFNNLPDQFSYAESKELTHKERIGDTIRILNELEADVTCLNEWNGNNLNPYHIDDPAKLKERFITAIDEALKLFAAKAAVKTFLDTIKAEVAGMEDFNMAKVEQKVEEKIKDAKKPAEFDKDVIDALQALADRLETITHAKDLYFYKTPGKWALKIVQKKSGTVVGNDGKPTAEKYDEPKAKEATSPMQSILMIINREKFDTIDDSYSVYTNVPENPGKANTQNFVTKRLTVKGTSIKIEVICTHMKSKYKMFPTRRKLARTISAYVEETRKTAPGNQQNFFLMGDMNSEIPEFAHDLNANILRLESQSKLPAFKFKPELMFTPLSQVPDIQKRITEDKKTSEAYQKYLNDYKQKVPSGAGASKFTSDEASFTDMLKETNAVTPYTPRLLWIETANFITEKKIRVAEIDYSNAYYQEYMKAYLSANPEIQKLVTEAEQAYETKVAKEKAEAFEKLKSEKTECKDLAARIPEFKESEKDSRNKKAEGFRAIVQDLRKRMNLKGGWTKFVESIKSLFHDYQKFITSPSKKWGLKDNNIDFYLIALMKSLLFAEIIDFVLLRPYNDFKVLETKSVKSYESDLFLGIPNKEFPSDHFPTIVKLNFEQSLFDEKQILDKAVNALAIEMHEAEYDGPEEKKLLLAV